MFSLFLTYDSAYFDFFEVSVDELYLADLGSQLDFTCLNPLSYYLFALPLLIAKLPTLPIGQYCITIS